MYFLMLLSVVVLVPVLVLVPGAESRYDSFHSFRTPCSSGITLGQLGDCIHKESNSSKAFIALEPLDPMPVDDLVVRAGRFVVTNKNVVLNGLKDTVVEDVVWDTQNNVGTILLTGNSILTSDYEIDGKIFCIPVNSAGKFSVSVDNAKYQIKFQFRNVEDEFGIQHVQVYDIVTLPIFEELKFQITSSIVGGVLDSALNAALNKNWKAIAPDAPSYAVASISHKITDAINKIYYEIPINDILQPVATISNTIP